MAERTIAGRYLLLEPLTPEGAWLAEDNELGRRVTLRLLDPDGEPFEAGARAAASLAHPHIARVYDYGESDGVPFVVTEHLSGGSLDTRLETGGPLSADEADRVARDVAGALAYAHGQGVAHGALGPASIEFDAEGRAKVTDFGTASGTPASSAADVAAFGALGFRMLTGKDPDDLSELERIRPDAPSALVAAVLAASSDDAATRPADAAGLVALLGPEQVPVSPPDESRTEVLAPVAAARARRSARAALGVSVGLLALLGAGIAVAFLAGGEDDGAAPLPSLSLPRVSTVPTATFDPPETSAPTTSETTTSTGATTTRPEPTTQAPPPTTTSAPEPTTEAPPPPPPTEEPTVEPTTTAATTTIATTTAP